MVKQVVRLRVELIFIVTRLQTGPFGVQYRPVGTFTRSE